VTRKAQGLCHGTFRAGMNASGPFSGTKRRKSALDITPTPFSHTKIDVEVPARSLFKSDCNLAAGDALDCGSHQGGEVN